MPHPCRTCGGDGRVRTTRTLRAKIPTGVSDGQVLRPRELGVPGLGREDRGDLVVHVDSGA